jgi:hypothetical protein
MSYEGYEQILCESGHLTELECFWYDRKSFKCSCGKGVAWTHSVDETNQSASEYPLMCGVYPLEIIKEGERKYCEHCNSLLGYEENVYKIPTTEEMKEYYQSDSFKKAVKKEERRYKKYLREIEKLNRGEF